MPLNASTNPTTFEQTVVVGAWHQYVDVIVPGNHSVVTGGSDGGAGTTVISEVILVADVDECLQYIEYCGVPFLLDVLNIHIFSVLRLQK
jgi:hypothetical protein